VAMSTLRGRELLLEAIRRGYTVDGDGNVFGPNGRRLSLSRVGLVVGTVPLV